MRDPTAWASVARLIRPQGRRGEILAEILTDFPERFTQIQGAFLARDDGSAPQPITVEHSWPHKGRIVLKLAGIDSISAAETLRGAVIAVPAAERMPLDEDAVYIGDLAGCQLIDLSQPNHPTVGIVKDVIQQETTVDLIRILANDGSEHWIPFAKAYLVRIDLAGRRLEMNLPAGLLEINAPLSEEEKHRQRLEESKLGGGVSGNETAGDSVTAEPMKLARKKSS